LDNIKEFDTVFLILVELTRANVMYPQFNSTHEGYAVLHEELDELWDEIKKKQPDKTRMREEATQVGAMAIKFILSCCKEVETAD
jgi:hypothetical protein